MHHKKRFLFIYLRSLITPFLSFLISLLLFPLLSKMIQLKSFGALNFLLYFACYIHFCVATTKVFDEKYVLGMNYTEKYDKCNMYEGQWVYDQSFPPYTSSSCPFIRKEFDCEKYGRLDQQYLHYQWQPTNCPLPKFDGKKFLNAYKGKKIMFIGDSLSLNHWDSLLCLLHAADPTSNFVKLQSHDNSISTVIFKDYKITLMLQISHYLVDIEKRNNGRVLNLNSLKSGGFWKNMDVLVFNTWRWWDRKGATQPWDYIESDGKIVKDMDRTIAFRKALTTWSNWVDSSIDPTKTKVMFQGMSPSHYRGAEWNDPQQKNCANEMKPISGSTYPSGLPTAISIVKDVLGQMKKKESVHFLDITKLSQLRKDGHPSSHNGFRGMDCTHWCVAGVPYTWNQLLYAALIG